MFVDRQVIKRQLEEGVDRRRVGLISQGAPARQHSDILTEDGQKVHLMSCLQPVHANVAHRAIQHLSILRCLSSRDSAVIS